MTGALPAAAALVRNSFTAEALARDAREALGHARRLS